MQSSRRSRCDGSPTVIVEFDPALMHAVHALNVRLCGHTRRDVSHEMGMRLKADDCMGRFETCVCLA